MNWKTCTEDGLIVKESTAQSRIPVAVEAGERFFHAAERTRGIGEYEMAHLAAYNSVFHCARAFLFSRGYTERSHVCIVIALRHLYPRDFRFLAYLSTLDKMRISRHNVQYGATRVTLEEAEFSCRFAGEFLEFTRSSLAGTIR